MTSRQILVSPKPVSSLVRFPIEQFHVFRLPARFKFLEKWFKGKHRCSSCEYVGVFIPKRIESKVAAIKKRLSLGMFYLECPSCRVVRKYRFRNINYYLAKKSLSRVVDFGSKCLNRDSGLPLPKELNKVVDFYKFWRLDYKKKFIHLSKGEKHIFIRQYSRFDRGYRKKIRKKMKPLNKVIFDLKIELTLNPNLFFTLKDEYYFINRAWNKLRNWFERRYGCKFDFLRILENQKKGRPHLHILFSFHSFKVKNSFSVGGSAFYRSLYFDLKKVWGKYGGGFVWVKKLYEKNRLRLTSYVMKYINKSSKRENILYSALLFASNKRIFSLSKNLQKLTVNFHKKKQGYIMENSVSALELGIYCLENYVEFIDFVVISTVDVSLYYKYPNLFSMGDYV